MAVTMPLAIIAMAVSMAVGLPLGILAARHRGRPLDTGLMVLSQAGVAVPNFWFGMLLTLVFAVTLRWRSLQTTDRSYKVFIHLLTLDMGTLVAQRDIDPMNGLRPTNTWSPGEIINDPHQVLLCINHWKTVAAGLLEYFDQFTDREMR